MENIMNSFGMINDYRIIINDKMTGETVKRTWKERLFTRPWQPFKKTKFNPFGGGKMIADGQVIKSDVERFIIMNSKTERQFRAACITRPHY